MNNRSFSLPTTDAAPQVGRYRLIRELGRGFSSVVYEAVDVLRGRTVALKVLTFLQNLTPERRQDLTERFGREARAISALSHQAIVAIYEIGEADDGRQFIAMEHLEGETLRARLQRDGTVPAEEAVAIALQIAEALQYAHERGIIHRDVKPDNVFLQPGGAKLMDFGVAHVLSDDAMTQTGMVVGSPAYMSPEQINGKALDGRSDVFSLGVTLAEMIAGTKPFEAPSIPAVMNQILNRPPHLGEIQPRALRKILAKALAKNPAARYPSPATFVEALRRQVIPQLPAQTSTVVMRLVPPPGSAATDSVPIERSNRLTRLAALCLLLLGMAGAAALPFLTARAHHSPAPFIREAAPPDARPSMRGIMYHLPALWKRAHVTGHHHRRHPKRASRGAPSLLPENVVPSPVPILIEERPVAESRRAQTRQRRQVIRRPSPAAVAPLPPRQPAAPSRPAVAVHPAIVQAHRVVQAHRAVPAKPAVVQARRAARRHLVMTATPPAVKVAAQRQEREERTVSAPAPPPDREDTPQPVGSLASAPHDLVTPDSSARVLHRTAPLYPDSALSDHDEGTVHLRVYLNDDGDVIGTDIIKSSGYPDLDDAAERCVRQWDYEPAFRNGQSVSSSVTERVVFRAD